MSNSPSARLASLSISLNAEASELLGHFLQVFRSAKRAFGKVVVDVGKRHPAAGAAEAHEFAVAVLGLGARLADAVAVGAGIVVGNLSFLPGINLSGILVGIVNGNVVGFSEVVRIDRIDVIGKFVFVRILFLSGGSLLRGLCLLGLLGLLFLGLLRLGGLLRVVRRLSLSLLLALRRLFLLGVGSLFGIRLLRSPSLGGLQSLRILSLLSRIRSLGRRLDHGFIRVVRSRLLCRLAHSALPRRGLCPHEANRARASGEILSIAFAVAGLPGRFVEDEKKPPAAWRACSRRASFIQTFSSNRKSLDLRLVLRRASVLISLC